MTKTLAVKHDRRSIAPPTKDSIEAARAYHARERSALPKMLQAAMARADRRSERWRPR
jgi:hypothetical protein